MCDLATVLPHRPRDLLGCHTPAALRHATRVGTLRRPFRGVVVGCDVADDLAVRVAAARLAVGRDLPAAFHTAAMLHGFGVLDDGRIHLVGPEAADHSPQPGLLVHSTARRPATCVRSGVPTTTAARCAVDLARTVPRGDALAVLDAALRSGTVDREGLVTELADHEALRGVRQARTGIEVADPRAESAQESRLRWLTLLAGLPAPRLQIEVRTPEGLFRLDMGYDEPRLGVEYDGSGHADRALLRYDRARHNALDAAGWRVLYFTDVDVYRRPQATVDRIAACLGLRAALLPRPRALFRRDQGADVVAGDQLTTLAP